MLPEFGSVQALEWLHSEPFQSMEKVLAEEKANPNDLICWADMLYTEIVNGLPLGGSIADHCFKSELLLRLGLSAIERDPTRLESGIDLGMAYNQWATALIAMQRPADAVIVLTRAAEQGHQTENSAELLQKARDASQNFPIRLADFEFATAVDVEVPDCILAANLREHVPNISEFQSIILALTFESGPEQNRSARSFVFYLFRGDIEEHRQPDDIITFKVKFSAPGTVHIVDKYLGGMAFGPTNAPPLAARHRWSPGMMSPQGQQSAKASFSPKQKPAEKSSKKGCILAIAGLSATLLAAASGLASLGLYFV